MARLRGKKYKLLITAGATREPIDPVRFISNRSTGRLGYVLAAAAKRRGHQATLIVGPTSGVWPEGVKKVPVETASEMERAVAHHFRRADALIMTAAVADFRPVRAARQKIKRSGAAGSLRFWQLELIENPDIVAEAGRLRKATQVVVGFALETERLLPNARAKLKAKSLDAIVATRLVPGREGGGPFGEEPVDGAILEAGGKPWVFRAIRKEQLATRILETVERLLAKRQLAG